MALPAWSYTVVRPWHGKIDDTDPSGLSQLEDPAAVRADLKKALPRLGGWGRLRVRHGAES
jgi:hypothetical protein